MSNAAILYSKSGYDGGVDQVKGRHVASASFLEAYCRYADTDRIYGALINKEDRLFFQNQVTSLLRESGRERTVGGAALEFSNPFALQRVGALYLADPTLGKPAWRRMLPGRNAYSLIGVTHTMSGTKILDVMMDLVTGPVAHWDALICTSTSIRKMVTRTFDGMLDHYRREWGGNPTMPIELPVIPLGVDAGKFEALGDNQELRRSFREKLGIAEDDLVALYFGRLTPHAKVHPVPMFVAADRAAKELAKSGKKLHLVMTGQFPNEQIGKAVEEWAASVEAVTIHILNGADREQSDGSWAIGDFFLSLSDNIQETFGITPIEAMAAGLPCVVSDWDGYKDTVEHGVTGIRVPTVIPPAGEGKDLTRAYALGSMNYDLYVGAACMLTSVSVEKTAEAIVTLGKNAELRREMGGAARRRVRELFDWSQIIPQYQALYTELENRRTSAQAESGAMSGFEIPNRPETFTMFSDHATAHLQEQSRVRKVSDAALQPTAIYQNRICNFARSFHFNGEESEQLFSQIPDEPTRVETLLSAYAEDKHENVLRTLVWFAKFGLIEIEALERGDENGE